MSIVPSFGGLNNPGIGPSAGNLLKSLLGSTSVTYQSPKFSAQIGDPNQRVNDLLMELLQGRNLQETPRRDRVDRSLTNTDLPGLPMGLPTLGGFSPFSPFGQGAGPLLR
jgi:hypothetical protein